MRLRTACDLEPVDRKITASRPEGFALPTLQELEADLPAAIAACSAQMTETTVAFEDELKKGKGEAADADTEGDDDASDDGK